MKAETQKLNISDMDLEEKDPDSKVVSLMGLIMCYQKFDQILIRFSTIRFYYLSKLTNNMVSDSQTSDQHLIVHDKAQ